MNKYAMALLGLLVSFQATPHDNPVYAGEATIFCDGFEECEASGPVPVISSFTRNVTNGITSWSSNGDVCLGSYAYSGSTPPSSDPWSGPKVSSGSQTVTLSTAGEHTLLLFCYGEFGRSLASGISVIVETPPNVTCDVTSPLIQPTGMQRINRTWGELFGRPFGCVGGGCVDSPPFPNSWAYPHPIGSNVNGYTVVPFIPQVGTSYRLAWDMAQPQSASGYGSPRVASLMLISISPCIGDLRPPSSSASDQFGKPACRKIAQNSTLFYSTSSSGTNQCGLQAGQTYYLNISPVTTTTGTPINTCPNGVSACEVQARNTVE